MVDDMTTNRNVEGKKVASARRGRGRMYGGLAGWTVAAAAASGLGLAAVSLLGSDLGTGAVAYAGTAGSPTPTGVSTSTVQSRQQAEWTAGLFATRGGQIIARCSSGVPSVTVVPATGWLVTQADRHSGTEAEVILTSGRDRIEVHIGCTTTGPTFNYRSGPNRRPVDPQTTATTSGQTTPTTTDDHGHGVEPGDDHGSPAATPTAIQTSTGADDHGGGSTEPGDDNGGRGVEPGDDNGRGAEPGDDRTSVSTTHSTTAVATTSTVRSTDSSRPTSTASSPSSGRGGGGSSSSSSSHSSAPSTVCAERPTTTAPVTAGRVAASSTSLRSWTSSWRPTG